MGLIPAHAGKTLFIVGYPHGEPAHPRSRGENIKAAVSVVVDWGSSPLTRGKPSVTPTATKHCPAHPRSRGENPSRRLPVDCRSGSSPLTRGKHPTLQAMLGGDGLIPAHAGKTNCRTCRYLRRSAHPRSRGENHIECVAAVQFGGSSPLTRGKRDPAADRTNRGRLIPAHAGKTGGAARPRKVRRAHPRSRGENVVSFRCGQFSSGSSPLTRGKPPWDGVAVGCGGLIPAHAGKTSGYPAIGGQQAAHPRSRGENGAHGDADALQGGSSPLTRGKRAALQFPPSPHRLIPAHAGKTGRRHSGCMAARAHPRSRGENSPRCRMWATSGGSSPLTRGKRVNTAVSWISGRLIPAHAGKTRRAAESCTGK